MAFLIVLGDQWTPNTQSGGHVVICKMSYLMLIGQVGIKNVDNTSKERKCGVRVVAVGDDQMIA